MMLRTASIAEQDIVQAALWLDEQQWGTGAEFLATIRDLSASISASPFSCPTLDLSGVQFKLKLRWRQVGRFPYLAVFTVENNEVVIVVVAHNRRDLETILRERVGVK